MCERERDFVCVSMCICSMVSMCSRGLRLKPGDNFMVERVWIEPHQSLSRGNERVTQYAARLVWYVRRGTWGLVLFTLGLILGDTFIIIPYLEVILVHTNSVFTVFLRQ